MTHVTPVLYVSHQPGCGGAELSLLDLLGSLDRERHPPLLVTSADGALAIRARALGIRCEIVPMLARGSLAKLRLLPAAARGVARLARDHRAAILHSNTVIAGYVALLAARKVRVPRVWHVRDIGYPWIARKACLTAQRVIANSHATADALRTSAAQRSRIRVVYNGVSPAFFETTPTGTLRAAIGARPDEPIVALVARCDPWKGHEDLITAVPLVLREIPRARFVIVGGQPLEAGRTRRDFAEDLARLADQLGVAERVHFLGQRDDVAELVRDIDLLAHPVREPEPFGRAVAEAFAAGKPVVASALGGLRELVRDGTTGRLVPPRDPGALAKALIELLRDRELRKRLGTAARGFAERECTTKVHASRIGDVYAELIPR